MIMKLQEQTGIVSPERGDKYTMMEALNKFTSRRNMDVKILDIRPFDGAYEYADDFDGFIDFDILSLEPEFGTSVMCRIVGKLPFHSTRNGKYLWGIWDSCSHDWEQIEEKEWYKDKMDLTTWICVWLGSNEEKYTFAWDWSYEKDTDSLQYAIQKRIEEIIKIALLDERMNQACDKLFWEEVSVRCPGKYVRKFPGQYVEEIPEEYDWGWLEPQEGGPFEYATVNYYYRGELQKSFSSSWGEYGK